MPGPPPKRAQERRRRNTTDAPIEAVADGQARGPKLTGRHSAAGRRFYEAVRRSGQAQFFEPSDWSAVELAVVAIDEFVANPSAAMFNAIQGSWSKLMVTEAERRRLRLELTRDAPAAVPAGVAVLDDYRDALGG